MNLLVMAPVHWLRDVHGLQEKLIARYQQQVFETHHFSQGQLPGVDTAAWGLIEIVDGLVGIQWAGNRLFTLERGDCWIGYLPKSLCWFQEGAVKLKVWPWHGTASAVGHQVTQCSDLMITLLQHNQFKETGPDFLHEMQSFREGKVIIEMGDDADSVYTLVQGKASVYIGDTKVGIVKEGEIVGLQALLLKKSRTATVVADTACIAIRVSYENFKVLIESRPDLAMSAMETMAVQISRLNDQATTDSN